MQYFACAKWKNPGFTFASALMALTVSSIVIGGLLYLFLLKSRLSEAQDAVRDMLQNTRIAIEVMSRELRMAGYNPTGASFDGVAYTPAQLHIRADLNGDGTTDGPDEDIRYTYEAAKHQIIRTDRVGQEPLAENIQAFTLAYLDKDGKPTVVSANVRQVRLMVTARAAEARAPYASQPGPRTYTLTTLVNLRNVSTVTEHGQS
jgi:type IV pilus assembly protein PilW